MTDQTSQQMIIDAEHAADELKKDLRMQLPTSLFMPIDRRDMLEVLTMQDEVAGAARGVAGVICARDLDWPKSMQEDYQVLVNSCINACEQAFSAISELDELIETGFDNSERKRISAMLVDLDAIELPERVDRKRIPGDAPHYWPHAFDDLADVPAFSEVGGPLRTRFTTSTSTTQREIAPNTQVPESAVGSTSGSTLRKSSRGMQRVTVGGTTYSWGSRNHFWTW